jgi:hypothetical protein
MPLIQSTRQSGIALPVMESNTDSWAERDSNFWAAERWNGQVDETSACRTGARELRMSREVFATAIAGSRAAPIAVPTAGAADVRDVCILATRGPVTPLGAENGPAQVLLLQDDEAKRPCAQDEFRSPARLPATTAATGGSRPSRAWSCGAPFPQRVFASGVYASPYRGRASTWRSRATTSRKKGPRIGGLPSR